MRTRKKSFNLITAFVFLFIFFLFSAVQVSVCHAATELVVKNNCGTVNRPLSVDPTGKSEGFSAVLFNNTNGLPTSEANAIAETSEGFIWIGSYAGLIRYDGNTFERMDSTGGLTSIKCLYVDSKDRLWIGTNDNGVAVMERGELRMWGKLDGMKSAHTRAITEDPNGTIYIATTSGIMMIDQDYHLSSLENPEIAEADMRYLQTGTDGAIYGTTNMGDLMVIRDGKLDTFISIDDSPLGGAGSILPDPEAPGKVYQEGADFSIYHVDLNGGVSVGERIDIEPLKYILNMEYIDGKIWICAGNGIGVLEDGKFRLIENVPMNNNVGHVMTDYLGNLWFTSTRQGVMKVVPNQFSNLFQRYGLPEAVVNSTCMCDGKLFAATDTGLMVFDENGPVSALPLKKAVTASGKDLGAEDLIEFLKDSRIRSVIRDSRDRVWISTWRANGLLRYDKGELTAFTEEEGILSNNLRAVSEREDGSILVVVTGGVNVIKDDKVIASYGKEDGIDTEESLTVVEGTDRDIVLGSNGGGIYVIGESGLKKTINVEDALPSDIVMRLKRDKKRDLIWIVASNAIAYMTPDYQVTTVKKFPYPNNFDLYETSGGDVWVLASNGI
ncbi:MAG: histidine kinase, partial [Lachnospiraceae bacterium]|nr:histidine kinase [Lachnospiraceae bacterium]